MNRNDYVPPSRYSSSAWSASTHKNYGENQVLFHQSQQPFNPRHHALGGYRPILSRQFYHRTEESRTNYDPRFHPRPPEMLHQRRHPPISGFPYQNNYQEPRTPPQRSRPAHQRLSFPYQESNNNTQHPRTPPRYSGSTQNDLLSPPNTHRVASSSDSFRYPPSQSSGERSHNASYPAQSRCHNMIPRILHPKEAPQCEIVGNSRLQIYRVRLPSQLLQLLNTIVEGCEKYAAGRSEGWQTDLYSLTKQDLPLREIPDVYQTAKPVVAYMKKTIARLYGSRSIELDRNQPHVKKYCAEDDSGHTGVELHYDKSDVTVNLSMSKSTNYVGGGTFFPAMNETVRLEFGEFLLHPGKLVHSGATISRGTRYLMVVFANVAHDDN